MLTSEPRDRSVSSTRTSLVNIQGPSPSSRTLALLGPLLSSALDELRANTRAQLLTLLGIVWGSAAVVLLLAFGAGFFSMLDLGFKKTGDRYTVVAGAYTSRELGGARPGRAIRLRDEDLERARASVPSARYVAAELNESNVVGRTQRRTRSTVVSGVTPEVRFIQNHRLARGRFVDDGDQREARPVVVLGATLAREFFGDEDPLGRTLQLDGQPFQVIGVLTGKGFQFTTMNAPHDEMAYIPLRQAQRVFGQGDRIGMLELEPHRAADEARMHAEVRAALDARHRVDPDDEQAYLILSFIEVRGPLIRLARGLEALLGAVGTIVLTMAAVGLANLMVALVRRRHAELALRRACGARRSDLMLQLLAETLLVVLGGGALGAAIGAGIAGGVAALPLPDLVPRPRLSLRVIGVTSFVLVAVGLVAGIAPARAASRVDPALALRRSL